MRTLALLAVLALAAALLARHLTADGRPPAVAMVQRVIDGDTVVIDGGEHVRLLGIDTPETVDPRRPVGCFGPQASAYTKHLLSGRRVELVYDRELRDRYGRLLAYLYLHRGGGLLFVNARLVALGYARTLSIPPNTAHAGELRRLEAGAALAGRGLWSACG